MFCHKCGAQIAEGAAFCYKCGTKVVYANTTQPPIEPSAPIAEAQQAGAAGPAVIDDTPQIPLNEAAFKPEDDTPHQASADERTHEKKPSKLKEWWDTAAKPQKLLAVLGALLAGGFVLYLLVAFLREFGYLLLGIAIVGGFIVTLITGSKEEKLEARKTIVQMVVGGAMIIAIACVVVLKPDFFVNLIQPGASVRNAYLTRYSENVTVGDAFDRFFDNGKWDAYKADGYSYVAFTGACEYLGKRADVKITFKITGENFVVDRLDVNGDEQSDFILYGLLSKVYEND